MHVCTDTDSRADTLSACFDISGFSRYYSKADPGLGGEGSKDMIKNKKNKQKNPSPLREMLATQNVRTFTWSSCDPSMKANNTHVGPSTIDKIIRIL